MNKIKCIECHFVKTCHFLLVRNVKRIYICTNKHKEGKNLIRCLTQNILYSEDLNMNDYFYRKKIYLDIFEELTIAVNNIW